MSELELENWMHASDEERQSMISDWDTGAGEGRSIAEACASLLVKECVYDVDDVSVIETEGRWQILAHADSDYESLKERDIDFLGFQLVIEKSII